MKKLYLVANWKSHMHVADSVAWLDQIAGEKEILEDDKVIVICPPFTLLQALQYKIDTFGSLIKVGAQDVSPFPEGAHTGEIAASQLKDFCSYVLVGHSERRETFHETDDMIAKKAEQALENGLIPICCVQDENTPVPKGVEIVAYEPTFAIGSGKPDTPENANLTIKAIKKANPVLSAVLYGGSVTAENVAHFTTEDAIDGVLVGSKSLDPREFIRIIQNA